MARKAFYDTTLSDVEAAREKGRADAFHASDCPHANTALDRLIALERADAVYRDRPIDPFRDDLQAAIAAIMEPEDMHDA